MQAELAFMNEDGSWAIISGNKRKTATAIHPMPDVKCPIVDTKTVTNWVKFQDILSKYILPCGITSITELLVQLDTLGVSVIHSTVKG